MMLKVVGVQVEELHLGHNKLEKLHADWRTQEGRKQRLADEVEDLAQQVSNRCHSCCPALLSATSRIFVIFNLHIRNTLGSSAKGMTAEERSELCWLSSRPCSKDLKFCADEWIDVGNVFSRRKCSNIIHKLAVK